MLIPKKRLKAYFKVIEYWNNRNESLQLEAELNQMRNDLFNFSK